MSYCKIDEVAEKLPLSEISLLKGVVPFRWECVLSFNWLDLESIYAEASTPTGAIEQAAQKTLEKYSEKALNYDFTGLTDFDLVCLQSEMRKSPFAMDKHFLDAILVELGKRQGKGKK